MRIRLRRDEVHMRHSGKTIPDAIRRLIELFAVNSLDRSTLDELHQMASDSGSWPHAHDLFQRITHTCSTSCVRRRWVLLWRPGYWWRRDWPDSSSLPYHLLLGRIAHENVTEYRATMP